MGERHFQWQCESRCLSNWLLVFINNLETASSITKLWNRYEIGETTETLERQILRYFSIFQPTS